MVLSVAYKDLGKELGEDKNVGIKTVSRKSITYLKMVELCYRYAYLKGRKDLGMELTQQDEETYTSLRQMLQGDPERQRRAHRRFPLRLPAVVKSGRALCNGLLLNLSASGMYLACSREADRGSTVQIKVGQPDEVEYLFTCKVVRCIRNQDNYYLGLSFSCIPIEMRK
jgi:hypothetical protein